MLKEIYGRDLLVQLAETDEAAAYWENADEGDIYEMCEALGYEWHEGGWYTPEHIETMQARSSR